MFFKDKISIFENSHVFTEDIPLFTKTYHFEENLFFF